MANLKYTTQQSIEELFDMQTGYVLDFSNNSFKRFIKEIINIDIYEGKGYEEPGSKANKLRKIFKIESNLKVAKLIDELLNYCEDYKLRKSNLTAYDKKKINDIRKDIEELKREDYEKVSLDEGLGELIQQISTRNAEFNQMAIDEKLKEIGNLIEYMLKVNGTFISLDYEQISIGFITENDIKALRKKVQCFRHSAQESIEERKKYTDKQKQFMVEFGIVICNLIYNELEKVN